MDAKLPLALSVGGATFLLGVIWGGPFVEILHRFKLGKQIRAELMDSDHAKKIGYTDDGRHHDYSAYHRYHYRAQHLAHYTRRRGAKHLASPGSSNRFRLARVA